MVGNNNRAKNTDFSIPDSHKEKLDSRLEKLKLDSLLSLEELKNQIEKRK